MANRTVDEAISVHGMNPQFLIEKILRTRIYESMYWKEHCFALNAETLIDKAVELPYIGGQYANTRPTEFLCLTLKLLQLQPEKEIILAYLEDEEFKYLRALAAFYLRLVGSSVEVYTHLEPLLADYRKLRRRTETGTDIICMDEFIDSLLREERVCDIILPRLTQRHVLEAMGDLEPRISPLAAELEAEEERKEAEERRRIREEERKKDLERERQRNASRSRERHRSRSRSRDRYRSRSRSRGRYRSRSRSSDRYRSRSRSNDRYRSRSRSRRYRSRSRSKDRYRSRSRSNDRHTSRRYRSRSRDRSYERYRSESSD